MAGSHSQPLAATVILSDDQLMFRGEEITVILKANVTSRVVSCCRWRLLELLCWQRPRARFSLYMKHITVVLSDGWEKGGYSMLVKHSQLHIRFTEGCF